MSLDLSGLERLHLIMGVQCNARCVMCYQTSFSRDGSMPAVIYQEHLKPVYPHIKTVKLQGGEPTVMRNCKDFCVLARGYPAMKIAVTTNGIFMNQFWLDVFVNQGLYVNVSLNAGSKEAYDQIVIHGNFGKAVGNIAKLVEQNQGGSLKVAMSMVIIRANAREIAAFLKLGHSLGVREINFGVDPILTYQNLPPKAELHELLAEAYQFIDDKGVRSEGLDAFARRVGYPLAETDQPAHLPPCPMPVRNLVVDEKGDVRVCCATWRVIGNTHRQGIEEILANAKRRRFQRKIARDDYSWCDPKCPDNRNPSRLAMYNKYLYEARRDPALFAGKVKNKLAKYRKI